MELDNERFMRNPDFVFRKIIEETILVPIHMDVAEMDCIYTLNEVGAFLWQQLETPLSFPQLQQSMLDEYDVVPTLLAADLKIFLDEMQTIGAIKRADL